MKTVLFLGLMAIAYCHTNAQNLSPEILSSAGETYQGHAMKIDWTLGELAIFTIQNSSQQITQGFNQSNYIITSMEELHLETNKINVYPNPTLDKIEMKLDFQKNRTVKIQLLDLNGKLIWAIERNGQKIKQITEISNLPNGNYFLNFLIDENKYSQTFKIQKFN